MGPGEGQLHILVSGYDADSFLPHPGYSDEYDLGDPASLYVVTLDADALFGDEWDTEQGGATDPDGNNDPNLDSLVSPTGIED